MKLTCNSCGTRFVIDDKLVRGKVVRLLCKHCSNIMEARLPSPEPPPLRLEPSGDPPRPPPPPGPKWYLAVGGRSVGPMSLAELKLRLRRGEATAEDLVWHERMGEWEPIATVVELRRELRQPVQATAGPPPLPTPSSAMPPSQLGSGPIRLVQPVSGPPVASQTGSFPVVYAQPQGYSPYGQPLYGGAQGYSMAAPVPDAAAPAGEALAPVYATAPTPGVGLPQVHYGWQPVPAASRWSGTWPLWLGILGGLTMVAAAITLFLVQHKERDRGQREPTLHRSSAAMAHQRVMSRAVPEEGQAVAEDELVRDLPAMEVRGDRHAPSTTSTAASAERPAPPEAPAPGTATPEDAEESDWRRTERIGFLLYGRVRPSLQACDRLAAERGLQRPVGARVDVIVQRSAEGRVKVDVLGAGVPTEWLSCYRDAAATWEITQEEADGGARFTHLP